MASPLDLALIALALAVCLLPFVLLVVGPPLAILWYIRRARRRRREQAVAASAPVEAMAVPTAPAPLGHAEVVQAHSPIAAQHASVADELSKLMALRDAGALTTEEFERQKQRLLA